MVTQEKVQISNSQNKKVFYETELGKEEKIWELLEGAKELKDDSWSGLLQMRYYEKNGQIMTLIRDQINRRVLLVEDDLENMIDELLMQLNDGISKYFGEIDDVDFYDREMEFYRTYPNEELYKEYFANVEIPIKLGNVEGKVDTIKVINTFERNTERGGFRAIVYYEDVLPILYEYIEKNYEKAN